MSIIVYSDRQTACTAAATLVASQLIEKPSSNIGLDYDESLIPVYGSLSAMSANGLLDWSRSRLFQLCEYVNSPVVGDALKKALLGNINCVKDRYLVPANKTDNWTAACTGYESSILTAGGMDLCLLSVRADGSVLFNVGGAELAPVTHVELANTVKVVTAGMTTVMMAKKLVVLITAQEKSKIALRTLSGIIGNDCPASFLQLHSGATFILDEAAAALL